MADRDDEREQTLRELIEKNRELTTLVAAQETTIRMLKWRVRSWKLVAEALIAAIEQE